MIINPGSGRAFLKIYSLNNRETISIDFSNTSYQIGEASAETIPLAGGDNFTVSDAVGDGKQVESRKVFQTTIGRKGFNSPLEIDTKIHIRIPFNVGDIGYLIDVTAQYKYSYHLEFLLPGPSMP